MLAGDASKVVKVIDYHQVHIASPWMAHSFSLTIESGLSIAVQREPSVLDTALTRQQSDAAACLHTSRFCVTCQAGSQRTL